MATLRPINSAPAQVRDRLAGPLLFVAVLGAFLPALRNGFINYDDPQYVSENPRVLGGLTRPDLSWAFHGSHAANWHPLTWISHMADCALFGAAPWGHHLTSAVLNAFNAVLVFVVFRRMTGAFWPSLGVAAFFGIHPLHVESVAWVAERKDVLCAFFGLLTTWAYVRWVRGRRREREEGEGRRGSALYYALALVFLALGLMSKAMLVTWPAILLLLDWWPLGRMAPGAWSPRVWARLVAEKIPFAALAAADAFLTLAAQRKDGAVSDLVAVPLGFRIGNALISCGQYLGKLFWPSRLAVFYPYPQSLPAGAVIGALALLLAITAAAWILRRTHPWFAFGWCWYLVTLAPVIGLVQVGSQAMADRYAYLPSIGVFAALVWGARSLAARRPRAGAALGFAAGVALLACAVLTVREIGFWRDSETLFRHALEVTDRNWLADNNLGLALADRGDPAAAAGRYREALAIEPRVAEIRGNLANALLATGQVPEAVAQLRQTLRLDPALPAAHNSLGNALVRTGDTSAAAAEYRAALRLRPDYPEALNNLANLLVLENDPALLPEAIAHYEAAVRLRPDAAEIRDGLGCALARAGRFGEARIQFEAALRLRPDDAAAAVNLAHLPSPDAAR